MTRCHDCDAEEGQLHGLGCDMEICPFCGGQLLSCDCCYHELGLIDYEKNGTKYNGLTYKAYSEGLNEEQTQEWESMLDKRGRIPWVEIPFFCQLCGEKYPEFFKDENWGKHVIPPLQNEVLCMKCYNKMKELFPCGWKKVEV